MMPQIRANGPLEHLGPLNKEKMGLFEDHGAPWSEMGPWVNSQSFPRDQERIGPLEAWGPLELDGAPDEEPMGP